MAWRDDIKKLLSPLLYTKRFNVGDNKYNAKLRFVDENRKIMLSCMNLKGAITYSMLCAGDVHSAKLGNHCKSLDIILCNIIHYTL